MSHSSSCGSSRRSEEGAQDEAMEASAERLMMFINNDDDSNNNKNFHSFPASSGQHNATTRTDVESTTTTTNSAGLGERGGKGGYSSFSSDTTVTLTPPQQNHQNFFDVDANGSGGCNFSDSSSSFRGAVEVDDLDVTMIPSSSSSSSLERTINKAAGEDYIENANDVVNDDHDHDGASTTSTLSAGVGSGEDSVTEQNSHEDGEDHDEGSSAIENEISFLQQKQSLLKRAFDAMTQHDAYEASQARNIVNGIFERPTSSIWEEAREVLDLLNSRDCGVSEFHSSVRETRARKKPALSSLVHATERTGKSATTAGQDEEEPPIKKVKINVNSVKRVMARTLEEKTVSRRRGNPSTSPFSPVPRCTFPSIPFCTSGPWMGQALVKSLPPMVGCGDASWRKSKSPTWSTKGWEVVNDPTVGWLVLPPAIQPLGYGIELKDALALTTTARLVTLSSPPFCIVHANKAFCRLSSVSSSASFIGKPVESLLQLKQVPTSGKQNQEEGETCADDNDDDDDDNDERTRFSISGNDAGGGMEQSARSCHLQVVPVTDKFRNPRGGISHLMVNVYDNDDSLSKFQGEKTPGQEQQSRVFPTSRHRKESKGVEHHPQRVFGTVG